LFWRVPLSGGRSLVEPPGSTVEHLPIRPLPESIA
jgi:hypothetical protein